MKRLFKLFGIIALTAVIGLSIAGCPTDVGEADTWMYVKSWSQVNGTWKAPSTVNYNFQGVKATGNTSNYTITFSAFFKTMSVSGTANMTWSGGDINTVWPDIKYILPTSNPPSVTVNINDTNHSYVLTYSSFSQTLTDADLLSMGLQINKNGTQIKVGGAFGEIVYTKQ
jgi:hypothetical protein